MIYGLPTNLENMIEPVPFSGCWIWTGAINEKGYGKSLSKLGLTNTQRVHRIIYELLIGPIQAETLDHTCRVRCCVNPKHLEPMSNKENCLRGESEPAKNSRKTHCKRGHPFSPENTYLHRNQGRNCKTCHKMRLQIHRILHPRRKGKS